MESTIDLDRGRSRARRRQGAAHGAAVLAAEEAEGGAGRDAGLDGGLGQEGALALRASGAVPQTVSPLTTCGPSAGSPPPDWKSRKAWAAACGVEDDAVGGGEAFQTMVSPGLTATSAAEPPALGTQVGVPPTMVPSISTAATGVAAVAREPLMAAVLAAEEAECGAGRDAGLDGGLGQEGALALRRQRRRAPDRLALDHLRPQRRQPAAGLEVEEGAGGRLGVEDDAVGGGGGLPDDGVARLDGDIRRRAAGLGHPGGGAAHDGAVDLDGRHRPPGVAREPLAGRAGCRRSRVWCRAGRRA